MSTETPTVNGKTREQRAAELEALDSMKELQTEADAVNLPEFKKGTSKAEARVLILNATFGVPGGTQEGTQDASGAAAGTEGAQDGEDADKGASKGKDKKEKSPLAAEHDELGKQLNELYEEMVDRITEAKTESEDVGAPPESADVIRTGAFQLLRQCNETLASARQFLEDAAKVVEQDNKVRQGIETAKKDLERRSEAYRLATNPDTGEKNAGQQ